MFEQIARIINAQLRPQPFCPLWTYAFDEFNGSVCLEMWHRGGYDGTVVARRSAGKG